MTKMLGILTLVSMLLVAGLSTVWGVGPRHGFTPTWGTHLLVPAGDDNGAGG